MKKIYFPKGPLNEVIFSLQYNIHPFDFRLMNKIYTGIKNDYPKIEEKPPLSPIYDKESLNLIQQELPRIHHPVRYFFIHKNGDRIIQIQEGKYLFNWRNQNKADTYYPRFEILKDEFLQNWEKQIELFKQGDFNPKLNQIELTYINHILIDENKILAENITDIIFLCKSNELLNELKAYHLNLGIAVKECTGHLNITIRSGIIVDTQKPVLILQLTVRGMSKADQSLTDWFNCAHDIIFKSFTSITTKEIQDKWGKEMK